MSNPKKSHKIIDKLKSLISRIVNHAKRIYEKFIKNLLFSITFKITTTYAILFTVFLFLLSVGIWIGFISYVGENAEHDMQHDLEMVYSYTKNYPVLNGPNEDMLYQLSSMDNIGVAIFDSSHNLILNTDITNTDPVLYSGSKIKNVLRINNNYMLVKKSTYDEEYHKRRDVMMVSENKATINSNTYYIQISSKLSREYHLQDILINILLFTNILFILITIFYGAKASKKVLKPIESMTNTAKNITISALDTRIDITNSQYELKELGETFNSMMDRLQESYEKQNRFVSDASHELRTPISVIQGYANLLDRWGKNDKDALDESIEAIKSEAESMKNLIEQLLFLARGDNNKQNLVKENFFINELIDEIVKETKLIDVSHKIALEKNEKSLIFADRKLIKQALRVFIDNSIKYTQNDGEIKIDCYTEKEKIVITIEDTGIGISEGDLPNIFDRFYRADKSRTKETGGTGLGLSIARWIIIMHDGTINVTSILNVGTKISIVLPV